MADSFIISKDDYFTRSQPAKSEELKNRIEVQTQPLLPVDEAEEIYKTGELIELTPSESTTITAYYTSQPAMIDAPLAPTIEVVDNVDDTSYTGGELQISAVTFYAWGASFTVENVDVIDGTGNVVITGYPLKVSGSETIIDEDEDSIRDYGLLKYTLKKNHLIQSKEVAELVAAALLSSYKIYRKDTSVTWRGNPVLELGDVVIVPEYERGSTVVRSRFKITKNQLEYDGTLKETTDGRKVGGFAIQDTDDAGEVFQDADNAQFIYQG